MQAKMARQAAAAKRAAAKRAAAAKAAAQKAQLLAAAKAADHRRAVEAAREDRLHSEQFLRLRAQRQAREAASKAAYRQERRREKVDRWEHRLGMKPPSRDQDLKEAMNIANSIIDKDDEE